jgi:hypothetical protein
MGHPFTFPGRYPVAGKNRDYPQEMALKAAEAHALRRAFDVTGVPAEDEWREPEHAPAGGLGAVLHAEQTTPEPPAPDEAEAVEPTLPGLESPLLDTRSKLAKAMYASIKAAGIPESDRIAYVAAAVGRDITSTKELTEDEARHVLSTLDDTDADYVAAVTGDET